MHLEDDRRCLEKMQVSMRDAFDDQHPSSAERDGRIIVMDVPSSSGPAAVEMLPLDPFATANAVISNAVRSSYDQVVDDIDQTLPDTPSRTGSMITIHIIRMRHLRS